MVHLQVQLFPETGRFVGVILKNRSFSSTLLLGSSDEVPFRHPDVNHAPPSPNPMKVESVIRSRQRALGGIGIRRVLPARERRMVGPFIFLDHLGPTTLTAGRGIDVPPHPHIHLATVTYLFEGSLTHRDSLGFTQEILPGEINWMHAGTGVVHSERSSQQARRRDERLHALQLWVALPKRAEETPPQFRHYPASELPRWRRADSEGCVLVGDFEGLQSPVATASPSLYVDIVLGKHGSVAIPQVAELGIYVISGSVEIAGTSYREAELVILGPTVASGPSVSSASPGTRIVLIGGDPLDGERHIWWNFVSSSPERIERARADWNDGRFDPVPGDDERSEAPKR